MNTPLYVVLVAFLDLCSCYEIFISEQDVKIKVLTTSVQKLELRGRYVQTAGDILLETKHSNLLDVSPHNFSLNSTIPFPWTFCVKALRPGRDTVSASFTGNGTEVILRNAFVHFSVMKLEELAYLSSVIGWLYFAAWSISFYPQVVENWRRKSVVGLNFDFLALNILGFILYSIYNCFLFWSPSIQQEYFDTHPEGLIPVQYNDIFFALHAVLLTSVTIGQCFIYEREEQKVSILGRLLLGTFFCVLIITFILPFANAMSWLGFLNVCGTIKLVITLIKYIPQAYMNYKRKTTVGWSIGNVLLDFTGGILSIIQMIIDSYNYDDWRSILGDPYKFGLGLFSVIFDILFVLQHYVFYRSTGYIEIEGSSISSEDGNNSRTIYEDDLPTIERSESPSTSLQGSVK